MDAAQSRCALGIGRVLDVPRLLENGLSLSWRRKIAKCQLLSCWGQGQTKVPPLARGGVFFCSIDQKLGALWILFCLKT